MVWMSQVVDESKDVYDYENAFANLFNGNGEDELADKPKFGVSAVGPPRIEEEGKEHYMEVGVDPNGDEPTGANEEWRYLKKVEKGHIFVDKNASVLVIRQHAIKKEFETNITHSNKDRYRAKCVDPNCKWVVYAKRVLSDIMFMSSPTPPPLLSQTPRPRWPPPLRAHAPGDPGRRGGDGGLDAILLAAELLCLAPAVIFSVVCAARLVFTPGVSAAPPVAGGRLLVVQYVLLVGAVAIGSLIRRRQWERLRPLGRGGAEAVGRIEKLEESMRGVVAAVGVLSRTVEKLGLRFRVLRRKLRDPISETATLAQKNSEATRILAAQENLLEKEIGAIQKVLYAMQEQQQKQLELILAIGEASRLLDGEQDMLDEGSARSSSTSPAPGRENKRANTKSQVITLGNNKP
ncbi:uncharacterized protein LOC133895164 [Phragmites australis]|uniref:uncharacterized protein LOC133895164 n=1 Tax=Phragmites australis TaxID=29695 RepID=UPI002D78BFE2|nr:uncharacterized protein LOC133895164 [Phragmites australis]